MDALFEPRRRDLLGRPVGLDALGERSAAAERLVEPGVGVGVAIRVALADPHVEIRLHLVDEPDLLPGELACGAGQRAQVRPDERCPRLVEPGWQLGLQTFGVTNQLGRLGSRFGSHTAPQGGVTGERVDVAFLDPVEAQSELQVLLDQAGRSWRRDTGVHAAPR